MKFMVFYLPKAYEGCEYVCFGKGQCLWRDIVHFAQFLGDLVEKSSEGK